MKTDEEKFREVFQDIRTSPYNYEIHRTLAGQIIVGPAVVLSILPAARTLAIRGVPGAAYVDVPAPLWGELDAAVATLVAVGNQITHRGDSFLRR